MAVNKTVKPARVEPGQVWSDNDPRGVHQEFTIEAVDEAKGTVRAKRGPRYSTIRIDRLYQDGTRGYTYLGRSK